MFLASRAFRRFSCYLPDFQGPRCHEAQLYSYLPFQEEELRMMLDSLSLLGWRRVSARFNRTAPVGRGGKQKRLPGFLGDAGVDAHNALLVVRPMLNSDGKDTVAHVCSVFNDCIFGAKEGGILSCTL